MLISVDERACSWFSDEFEKSKPFSIRLFPQYGGFGQKHKGYSLAFSADTPINAAYSNDVNGITFYFEENDAWFFDETKTILSIDDHDELQISFTELSSQHN